jgi:hypothetical protein
MKSVPLGSQNTVEFTASLPFSQHNLLSTHILVPSLDYLGSEEKHGTSGGAMRKGKDKSLLCLWCFQSAFRQTAKHLNVSTMLSLMLDQMV